jgi:RNA polymerase sigma factor for flagellar operon FliA
MAVTAGEFEKLQRDCSPSGFVSLSRKWYETDSSRDICEIDVLEDVTSENPIDNVLRDDIQDLVTRGLSKAERLIIVLYYFEELTMKEIGRTLALSESRVSQMHTAIIQRLQCQLESRQSELQPI